MQAEMTVPISEDRTQPIAPARPKSLRLWLPFTLIGIFWTMFFVMAVIDKPYFVGFIYSMAAPAALALIFFGWWWTRGKIRWSERAIGFFEVIALGIAAAPFCDRSVMFAVFTLGFPLALTAWTIWLALARSARPAVRLVGLLAVTAVAWGSLALVRNDGVDSNLTTDYKWRWSPTAEALFLAQKAQLIETAAPPQTVAATQGDWTEFRGPDRDGVIRGDIYAKGKTALGDWNTSPPKLLWKQRVGPAWSSVIVVGDSLYTQEQRGEKETVVCYDAATGKERWVQETPQRFWDAVSGAGPRATPTFVDGRLYTFGATGVLNCIDAATGKPYWSRDAAADAGSKHPMWGFSGSPLVTGGLVIVFAGGPNGKSLLAYRTDSGAPAWTAGVGEDSYSSPQLTTLGGKPQCLMLADQGLVSVDPATGTELWRTGLPMPGAPRVCQPHLVGSDRLVVATLQGNDISLIKVTETGGKWTATDVWESTQMKPEFPDFVVYQNHVYGFDGNVFCCIDLANGKRSWKDGRYGCGQVMLLPDQARLLVQSETGDVVVLAADPTHHQELGRIKALKGKTWNHPVIAHGRLYVRNAEEMACYQLGGE